MYCSLHNLHLNSFVQSIFKNKKFIYKRMNVTHRVSHNPFSKFFFLHFHFQRCSLYIDIIKIRVQRDTYLFTPCIIEHRQYNTVN
jgi:hypothetical protein